MPETPIVEARPAASPVPEPTEPAAAPTGGVDLSDELIQIPAMQAITAGQPAAFSALLTDFDKLPEAKTIANNKDNLMKAGYGLYRSLDGAQGVVFNQIFVSPDDIKNADQAGTLLELAPPFAELNAAIGSSGSENPVLQENERPSGFKIGSAAVPIPPNVSEPKPPPAGVQKTLASKRSQNMQPTSPTAGAGAGQGNLLRSIMRPIL